MTIERRRLGRTGVDVTILGYGAMELRGAPRGPVIADEEAGKILNAVLDNGVNLIDTSVDYGESEELIGKYISERREEYFLASKCGCDVNADASAATGPLPHDFRAPNVRAGVEQSLRRMHTDRLDLVQVHMSPSREQLELDDTVGTLATLKDEGKLRFIGMSGTIPNLSDHIDMDIFDVFQIPYSAVQREHEELISKAADRGAGTLIRGGAARGAPSEEKNWNRGPIGLADNTGKDRWDRSSIDEILNGMSRIEFVLRFTLSHPGLSSTIVGTSRMDHLKANVEFAEKGALPMDLYEEAKRRLDGPDLK